MFVIGQSDDGKLNLTPLGGKRLCIYPGAYYHYGYSNSPESVLVTEVGEAHVTYCRHPFGQKVQREQRELFQDLAFKGTTCQLKQLDEVVARLNRPPEWMTSLTAHYRAVLSGREGLTWDRAAEERVGVKFLYHGKGDGWSEFERHYPHSICGGEHVAAGMTLTSYDFSRKEAEELRSRMGRQTLPDFRFIDVIPYH